MTESLFQRAATTELTTEEADHLRVTWFTDDNEAVEAFESLRRRCIGMTSAEITQFIWGSLRVGWTMHQLYQDSLIEGLLK